MPNADGTKANLLASIGPAEPGGVVLSGHTDVVPVDGQPWTSDPFMLTARGRQALRARDLRHEGVPGPGAGRRAGPGRRAGAKRPVHLAFSYDEEIGCLGAPDHDRRDRPRAAARRPWWWSASRPTWRRCIGHKGIATFRVTVHGHEAHSSQTHLGVSAIMAAVPLMAELAGPRPSGWSGTADPASPFTPKGATLTIGQVNGGTAGNILARECEFLFDLRYPPGPDPGRRSWPPSHAGRRRWTRR